MPLNTIGVAGDIPIAGLRQFKPSGDRGVIAGVSNMVGPVFDG